jgi:hypothetical protein
VVGNTKLEHRVGFGSRFGESGWNMDSEITVIKRTQVMKPLLLTISARRYGKVNSAVTATTSSDPNITSDPRYVRFNISQIQHTSDPNADPTATDPVSSDLDICSFSTPAPSSNTSTHCSADSRNYSETDPTVPDPDPNYW